jgi:hypothetical protein
MVWYGLRPEVGLLPQNSLLFQMLLYKTSFLAPQVTQKWNYVVDIDHIPLFYPRNVASLWIPLLLLSAVFMYLWLWDIRLYSLVSFGFLFDILWHIHLIRGNGCETDQTRDVAARKNGVSVWTAKQQRNGIFSGVEWSGLKFATDGQSASMSWC